MRLLYVCSDWGISPDGSKGASIHLRSITRALSEIGHDVQLLSPKGEPGNGHPAKALLTERCHIAEDAARMLRDWLEGRDLPAGIGREIRPLLFNPWALPEVLAKLYTHKPAAIIERLSLFGHLGLDLANALDLPLIVEVNAPLTAEASTYRSLQLRDMAEEIEQRVLRRADRIAVVSGQLRDLLAGRGLDAEKIEVVPNGIDARQFIPKETRTTVRSRLGLNGGFVAGFVGSLKSWHGVGVLLEAFHEIAKSDARAKLLVVGTGPSAEALRADVERRGLADRVVMTGAVPHDEIASLLGAMDVAVAPFLPIDDFYFSPIKLFEYMAAGACVIASRLGQIAEVIEDGVDGLLCEAGDAAGLYEQMDRARQFPLLRKSLGEKARTKALARFTWERAARQMEAMVESVLADRQERSSPPAEALEAVAK